MIKNARRRVKIVKSPADYTDGALIGVGNGLTSNYLNETKVPTVRPFVSRVSASIYIVVIEPSYPTPTPSTAR